MMSAGSSRQRPDHVELRAPAFELLPERHLTRRRIAIHQVDELEVGQAVS